jgi:hypothetical protein
MDGRHPRGAAHPLLCPPLAFSRWGSVLKSRLSSSLSRLLVFSMAVASSLTSLVVGIGSPPVSAATNGQYSIFPAVIAGSTSPQRVYFNYLVNPGTAVNDAVAVTNQTANTLQFQLIPADGVNTKRNGGFTLYEVPNKPLHSVGAWVKFSDLVFTMPPHTIANVPFTIDVPPGLTPGDYAGGIILQPTTPAVNQRGNVTVELYQDVGARIYLRVRGPLHPGLSVTQLSVDTHGAAGLVGGPVGSTVTYTLTNTGNQILNPTAKLSVSPLLGSAVVIPPKIFSSLLPHNSVTVTYKLKSKEALLRMNANLSVSSGAGTTTAATSAWVIPWIIVVIILVIVGLLWYLRRRRRRTGAAPTPPAEPEPAAAGSRV